MPPTNVSGNPKISPTDAAVTYLQKILDVAFLDKILEALEPEEIQSLAARIRDING